MTVMVDNEADGMSVTSLTGIIDQTALQGFLRWLYSLCLPMISGIYKGSDLDDRFEVSRKQSRIV